MTRAIRQTWTILIILLLYTILMVISIASINIMNENEKTRSKVKFLESDDKFFNQKRNIKSFTKKRDQENLPRVYTFSNGSWTLSDVCKPLKHYANDDNFVLTTANSEAGSVSMFVHNPKLDAISGTIQKRRSFESENVDAVISLLRNDQELSLIDIGTNVGLHALSAALLGRQVLAIDAGRENIEHVCASVQLNKFNNVALVHNALSDKNSKVTFRYGTEGDFGLAHVDSDNIAEKMRSKYEKYFKKGVTKQIDAVKMDDILSLPRLTFFRKFIIKMDVEGHEHRVLLGAKKFMQKKRKSIKGIFMEWQWFSGRDAEHTITSLMTGWNFEPFRFTGTFQRLNLNNTNNWPKDILWLPRASEYKIIK